eukprot:COSAG02_NODE_3643_length_6435_cov_3.264994_5_plen_131_part_00
MQAGSGNIMTLHPSSLTACEDMVSLGDMNNAALLHNLRLRYWEDDIFVSRRAPPSSLAHPLVAVPGRLRPRLTPRTLARRAHSRWCGQTYIGPILIAVNPYKAIPIFSPGYVDKYFNQGAADVSSAPQPT